MRPVRLVLALVLLWAVATPVAAVDAGLCLAAIRAAEAKREVPGGLLTAVATVESGRRDPSTRQRLPWPWTVNDAGDGRHFATKAEAVAHVRQLLRQGRRSLDVGCMQINLKHHPDAFASLEEALDPKRNVAYGAAFLARLQEESGSWQRAVERYHSGDPVRGRAYRRKVMGGSGSMPSGPARPQPGLLGEIRPRGRLAAPDGLAATDGLVLIRPAPGSRAATPLRPRGMAPALVRPSGRTAG